MTVLRSRNAAVLAKIESTPGTYDAPNTSSDGVLVEAPTINTNPQNQNTDEVTGSLDGFGPLVGGTQCEVSFTAYVKGGGTPGVAPEWGKLLRASGWLETATRNTITGTTLSVSDSNTIADSGSGLAALTIGTVVYVSGFDNSENNGEFIVTANGAGASIDVTKLDGSAPGLTAESAGNSVTIAYGIAAVDATAGDATSATAQSPWSSTAQAYRGMPVVISGNPATPDTDMISDYTSGRVATVSDNHGTPLDSSSVVSIPANVMYSPASSSIPAASLAVYMDGVQYKFRGARGNATVEATSGGGWKLAFRFSCLFEAKVDASMVTPTYDNTRPGIWRNSVFAIDRTAAGLQTLSIDPGNQLTYPPNPNDTEGFDPPEITRRDMTGNMDPNAVLVATRDLLSDMRAGTTRLIHARMTGGQASNPGQRVGLIIPTALPTGFQPGDRQNVATEQVPFYCKGQDSGAFLAIW